MWLMKSGESEQGILKSLTPCLLLEQGNIEEFDTLSASLMKKVLSGSSPAAVMNQFLIRNFDKDIVSY